jgi:hypothetical protein
MEFVDIKGKVVSSESAGAVPSAPALTDIGRRATGRYDGAGDDKADQVIALARPANPDGDVRQWLDAHNAALLGIVRGRYSAGDISRFTTAERSTCSANVYCIMAFRQQAIALIVGG